MSSAILAPLPGGRSARLSSPLPRRRFGKTEEQVPVLGLGTGPAGSGLSDAEAVALYEAAIDRGVTYLDTAPSYGRAQLQLGQVLPRRREEVFVATKCYAATAAEALQIHEQSLRDLRTDHVDLLYAHCVAVGPGSSASRRTTSPPDPSSSSNGLRWMR